jgi:phi LC3 family holin
LGEQTDKILAVINTLFVVLGTIGVVNDPTTYGLNDSDRAMQYSEPVKREIGGEDG